ncbi:hypothetical protein [Paenibacillus sp. H1-7]|uniref:hypothetical protein n=1 Tax=Paenibacillus sp. H1-7 TaxID=2282849 RepID=UPI001EF8A68D|nr:hypothetical protein [Paenibacillus sp. H1-7]
MVEPLVEPPVEPLVEPPVEPLVEPLPELESVDLLPVEPLVEPLVELSEPVLDDLLPLELDPLPEELPLPPGVVEEEPDESDPFGVLVVGTLESLEPVLPLSSAPLEHPVTKAKTSITPKAHVKVFFMFLVSFHSSESHYAAAAWALSGTSTMYNKNMIVLCEI